VFCLIKNLSKCGVWGDKYAGLAQLAARQSHNLKVVSSNLTFRIIFYIQLIFESKYTNNKQGFWGFGEQYVTEPK